MRREILFEKISPNYIIITTPNREFNKWFGDEFKIRDPDHKFEWNQKEFLEFINSINFDNYEMIESTGVGLNEYSKKNELLYGYATQIVIFKKKIIQKRYKKTTSNIKLYSEIIYPKK